MRLFQLRIFNFVEKSINKFFVTYLNKVDSTDLGPELLEVAEMLPIVQLP